MALRKPSSPAKRVVWRITESAPLGEFVDPQAVPATPVRKDLPEAFSGGWVVSSFELLHGTDISEAPDTVPDELFDELFAPPKPPPKTPERK